MPRDVRTRAQRLRLRTLRGIGRIYAPRPARPQPAAAGSASETAPRSVLLIRPDHLGDLLFLTPALHALRAARPDVRLDLLAGPWGVDAVRGNADLDRIHLCRFPGFERRPKDSRLEPYRILYAAAAELRATGYDAAVVLRFDHWWGAWLAAAAGIPRRIGYAWPETQPFVTEAYPYNCDRHEVEQNAHLLAALVGAPLEPGPLRYAVAPADADWAERWLAGHGLDRRQPLVAVHPGAGAAVKQWPAAAWSAVADSLAREQNAQILLTGSAGERVLTLAVAAGMARPALDVAGQTTLGQLAALQARCALVLGSDSGPLHLAVAAGVPTVHLYGPAATAKFGAWGDPARHRVVTSPWACVPCDRLDWTGRALAYHACMAAITVDTVLAAARQAMASKGH